MYRTSLIHHESRAILTSGIIQSDILSYSHTARLPFFTKIIIQFTSLRFTESMSLVILVTIYWRLTWSSINISIQRCILSIVIFISRKYSVTHHYNSTFRRRILSTDISTLVIYSFKRHIFISLKS